jgi:glucose/arabinose dehydrogenase
VARYALSSDNVATFNRVLVDNVPAGGHNGGDLHFGKDGYLYVSTGDGQCDYAGDSRCGGKNDASRDQHALVGKILRITRDGAVPADNPYRGVDSARCNAPGTTEPGKRCQETFAWGLRNPFRMAFDPNAAGTRFVVNDVGELYWEEIDEGQAGADYGWNVCEGNHDNPTSDGSAACDAPPYTAPTHEYDHTAGCASITGGAFVPKGVWLTEYDEAYLFGDYVCNKIFKLTPNVGGGFTSTEFASGLGEGGPIAMTFGPYGTTQALYYTTYANGGEVHRIAADNDVGDIVKPSGTVLINGGAARTKRRVVNLALSASDPEPGTGVDSMRFSNDGTTWSTWEPYGTSKVWYLSSGYGTKTVYVQFRDRAGNASEVATDTIRRVRRR